MTNCGCIVVYNDGSSVNTILNSTVKALTSHKCGECRDIIPRGEKYEFLFGTLDDELYSSITCLDCLSIREEFFCNGFTFGTVLEDVYNHIYDMDGQISSECILNLTPGAQEIIFNAIEDYWEEYAEEFEEEEDETESSS